MPGKIFINYRREDSIAIAGRLHDRLSETFGRDNLFMDVDNIPIGINFEEHLKSQVAACDAMLSIVGPNWLNAKDETDQRRLDKPDDFVAIEIEAALARDILVIPVLVDSTHMPKASELPASLKLFALRNAIQVRNTNFGSDAEALVKKMREALGDKALVSNEREVLGEKGRSWSMWKKHVISTAIGLVIALLVLAWLQPDSSGGVSLVLLFIVTVANACALLIPLKAPKHKQ